jgi:carbon storage regulator
MESKPLVLSRYVDESIMIGDELLLTVVQIRSNTATVRATLQPVADREVRYTFDCTLKRDDRRELQPEVFCSLADVRGDKVRLSIQAPRTISVHRKEVYDAIRSENDRFNKDSDEGLAGAAVPRKPKPGSDSGSVKREPPAADEQ